MRRISGSSHHFLRTRMKAQRSAKMESLDTCAEGTKYDESIGLGLGLGLGLGIMILRFFIAPTNRRWVRLW